MITKIKLDKDKKQVIFQYKTTSEMKYILDLYKKGAEQTGIEARRSIDIPSTQVIEGRVEEKVWDADDTYLVVEVQVNEQKFHKDDKVKVTIEKLEE